MASMMGMASRRGPGEAVIGDSIGRGSGTVLGCTGFIPGMFMRGNGPMGRAMDVECTLVRMGVDMSGSSSGASSMALATTISGD